MSYAKRPHSPSSSGSPPAKRRAQSPEEGEVENEKTSKHPFPFNNSTNRDYPKSPRRHRLPPRPPSPRNYDRWKNGKRDDESLSPLDTPGAPRAVERVGIEEREEGEETPTSSPRGRDRSRERGRQGSPGRSSSRNRNESRGRDRWRRKPDTIDPKLNSAVEDTIARIEREADAAEAARKKEERPKALRLTPDQEMQSYGRKFVGTSQLRDYAIMEKLGEGTFGEVHKATHTVTRKVVALKRILMHNEKEGLPVTALREIKILKKLRHPSVVTVCDMVVEASTRDRKGSIYMVFPYMDHDLAGLLENPSVKFSPSQIKLYMRQLLEGTEYLHQNKILHRDLKAANLLINNQGSLQIADFGLARPYSTTNPGWDPRQTEGPWDPLKGGPERGGGGARYTNCVVTRWYRPPELLMGDARYGCAIDMWGVGCIMGEMWTRRPILAGSSDADQLERIWELCGTPEDATWPGWRELPGMEGVKVDPGRKVVGRVRQFFSTSTAMDEHGVDLVCKLLTLNPATRATAFEALDHDYFWTEPLPCDPASLPKYVSSHEYDKRKHKAEPAFPPQGGFNMPGPGPGPNFRPSGQWVGPNHGPNHGNHGNHGPNHGPNHGNHGSGYGPGPGWDRGRGRGRGMGRGRGGYNHHSGHNHNGPNHGGNYNGPNHGPPHNHGPPGPPGPNGPPVNFSGYARPPDDRGGGLPPPLGTHSRQHREMRERNMRGRGPAHQPLPSKPEGDVLPYG